MKTSTKIILVILVLVVAVFLFRLISNSDQNKIRIGPVGSTHEHAVFQMYLNGQFIDFAKPKYMVKIQQVHIEGMNGENIHKHATGVTIGYFLKSLGFRFNADCLTTDKGADYCDDSGNKLELYVNGELNNQSGNYEFGNDDIMLITYGSQDSEIKEQLNSLNKIRIKR